MPEAKIMKKEFLKQFKQDYLETFDFTAGAIDTAVSFITSYMPDSYSYIHNAVIKAINEAIEKDEYLCDDAEYGFGNGKYNSYNEFIKNNGDDTMNVEEAYIKIKAYDEKIEEKEKMKILRKEQELEELKEQIRALKPRIRTLIEIGGYLHDSDNINEKDFITNAMTHKVGIYEMNRNENVYKYLGIRNGGANGNIDFITDGDIVQGVWFDARTDAGDPTIYDCKKFLKNFEEFEKKVFDFINNL